MFEVHVARKHRLLWVVAIALAAVGTPRRGRAAGAVVATRFEYSTAPGCPTGDDFRAIVTARLGYGAFRAEAPDLVIVRIERAGRTLEGRLEWRDAKATAIGAQTFPSRTGDCAELARAMAFALALQIQLMAVTMGDSRSAATPPPPAAGPVESAGAGVSESRSPPRGPSLLAGGGALAGLGISSAPIAIGRLFAAAAWPRVALELAGEVSVPSTTTRADGAGFSQEQFLASLAGCGVRSPWSLCAVAKAGELRVAGQGVDVPRTASGLMIQSGLRLAASHVLGQRAYVIGHAEGLARLTPGTVRLDFMPVWTTPRFAALLGIDVAFRFR